MHSTQSSWKLWAAAVLSAGLLELPFPLAGPLPPWRSVFAWFALVPLLWALLAISRYSHSHPLHPAGKNPSAGAPVLHPTDKNPSAGTPVLRRAFFIAYLCGFLWYMGNCYWVRDTMLR